MAVHQLTCRGCGEQFQYHRRKAFCRPECRASATYRPTACEGCGEEGPGLHKGLCRSCLTRHRKIAQATKDRKRDGRQHLPPMLLDSRPTPATQIVRECVWCGTSFYPKKAENTLCCSRECGFRWGGAKKTAKVTGFRVWVRTFRRKKQKPKVSIGACSWCGAEFARLAPYQRVCGDECANAVAGAAKDRARDRAKETRKTSPSRRAYKKRRKAIERGARRAECVDPLKVFARDGWRCQMCGSKTPERLRGTYNSRAPELDHIIALANGGSHTYANTQCLCRSCNSRKGASDFGQLNLFPAAG